MRRADITALLTAACDLRFALLCALVLLWGCAGERVSVPPGSALTVEADDALGAATPQQPIAIDDPFAGPRNLDLRCLSPQRGDHP